MGLDGKPRPINIEHGKAVMNWSRTKDWVKNELINILQKIDEGEGWVEEKTGLNGNVSKQGDIGLPKKYIIIPMAE